MGRGRKEEGIERKIMQMLLSGVRITRVHRGWKIIADSVIAVLRALTQNKGKCCHVKQDPRFTPNKSIKILGSKRETKPACSLFVFFFFSGGWYSTIANLEAH